MAMTPIILEAVINSDVLKHQAAGTAYYIMGGGTAKAEGDGAFNVREIDLTSVEIPDGVDAEKFVLPGGLVLIGADAALPLTGKLVRITIEEIVV